MAGMPGGSQAMPAYSCRGLKRRREKSGVIFELEVPELDVARGEFVAVVGSSGCGKSTLLDMLGLVLAPDKAETFSLHGADGKAIDVAQLWSRRKESELARVRRERLGYVLQAGGLLPFLSVMKNIRLPVGLKRSGLDDQQIRDLAGRLGIADMLGKKPGFLSGGQRQRAAILRAVCSEPDIILADEPTAAVDEKNGREIVEVFQEIAAERGAAVIMVTHDVQLVEGVADKTFSFELSNPEENPNHTRSTCKLKKEPD